MLFIASSSMAELIPSTAIYVDTVNQLNLRGGLMYSIYEHEYKKDNQNETENSFSQLQSSSVYAYSNIQLGWHNTGYGIGLAKTPKWTNSIFTLGYHTFENESREYQGIESGYASWGYYFKLGYYEKENSNENVITFGIGIGI